MGNDAFDDPGRAGRGNPLRTILLWGGLLIAVLVAGFLILAALNSEDEEDESAGTEVEATLSEIAEDVDAFDGEVVAVSGDVNHVIGPRAFVIVDGDEAIVDDEVLVLTAEPLPEGVSVAINDIVRVVGAVREYDPVEVEEELGDLGEEAEELEPEYVGWPTIIAAEVEVIDE